MIQLGTPRHHFRSLSSTMDALAELALAGAPEGTLVVTDEQLAGRGRAGRSWQAVPGTALLCSVLLRPPLPLRLLGALPLIAGLAVAEAIESLVPVHARLKWPNDVFIHDRKVCGVLMQARAAGDQTEFVNLGIGLNVSAFQNELPARAISLKAATGREVPMDSVERAIMQRLSERYLAFIEAAGEPPLDDWTDRAMYLGERIEIEQDGQSDSGTFTGVSARGALLLTTSDGLREVVSGDLTRGPRRPDVA